MPRRKLPSDPDRVRRLVEHYEIERELAERLMSASRAERATLYKSVYDELFRRVPNHPQLVKKSAPSSRRAAVRNRLGLIGRSLGLDKTFLEIGPGDLALTRVVAERVAKIYAVDVSSEITAGSLPDNVELILSDGSSIDVPAGSVDVAYSDQLMEHLHPDDALEQLGNIARVLKDGGVYFCLTPNRLTGPHDISVYFSDEARGFHLREYTNRELRDLFLDAGFAKVDAYIRIDAYIGTKVTYVPLPVGLKIAAERLLVGLPPQLRSLLCRSRLVHSGLDVVLAGRKAT